MVDDDGAGAALGLRSFARVIDDEGIELWQRSQGDFWPTGGGQRSGLARQPFQIAVLAIVDNCIGAEHMPQPEIGGEIAMRRHQVRNVDANGSTTVCDAVQLPNIQGSGAFIIAATLIVDGEVVSREVDWPQPLKFISFHEARGLQVQLDASRNTVEITSRKPVKGLIFAERPGLSFSDNGVDVVPGEKYSIDVQGLGDDEQLEWSFLGMNEAK